MSWYELQFICSTFAMISYGKKTKHVQRETTGKENNYISKEQSNININNKKKLEKTKTLIHFRGIVNYICLCLHILFYFLIEVPQSIMKGWYINVSTGFKGDLETIVSKLIIKKPYRIPYFLPRTIMVVIKMMHLLFKLKEIFLFCETVWNFHCTQPGSVLSDTSEASLCWRCHICHWILIAPT